MNKFCSTSPEAKPNRIVQRIRESGGPAFVTFKH